jgi:hypothetical protein
MPKLDLLDTTFSANASSIKFWKIATGIYTRNGTNIEAITQTIPHGYASDKILVFGQLTTSNNQNSEVYTFMLPYLSALGEPLTQTRHDSINVYLEDRRPGQVSSGQGNGYVETMEYIIWIFIP